MVKDLKSKEHLGDLAGKLFCDYKLTAIERVENKKDNHKLWRCKCNKCGKDDIIVRAINLVKGKSGCKCSTHVPIIINGVKHKRCSKCDRVLTYDQFNKAKKYEGDGLKSQCRECQLEDDARYREENREKERDRHYKDRHANNERNLKEDVVQVGTKWCPKCERDRNAELFNIARYSQDGMFCWCVDCAAAHGKSYREKNKEKIANKSKAYGQTPLAKLRARVRKAKRARDLGSRPINVPPYELLADYEQHHLQLRTKESGKIDKDKTVFIPVKIHASSGMRHNPEGRGRNFRRNMPKITAAAFSWLLTEEGLFTLARSGEEYKNLLELIEEGKRANLEHIPEEYREAHFKGIAKLDQFIKDKLNNRLL